MVIFADVQYCINADQVGGSEKVQKYADVICIGIVPLGHYFHITKMCKK